MGNPYAYSQFVQYILTCDKTGRYWKYSTLNQAERAARHLGLKDYTITEITG